MEQDITDTEDKMSEVALSQEILSDSTEIPQMPVLPPITPDHNEMACQTDISLLSGDAMSTFRPSNLQEEISPYPPLPVISTASAPALLRGDGANEGDSGAASKDSQKISDSMKNISPSSNANQDSTNSNDAPDIMKSDSKSDLQPTDDETASTYSTMSELDGVGPPTILQYIKESTRVRRSVPAPKPLSERLPVLPDLVEDRASRFPTVDPSIERGNMCPFCHTELLPVPPLSDGSDDEVETPTTPRQSISPPYNIKDSERGDGGGRRASACLSRFSVESPPPVITLPEDTEDDKLPCDGYLYCCEDYYWHLVNKTRMERRDSFYQEGEVMEVKKIDVSPHAPFGSKAARKVAKDRANERVRERELEKVRPLGGGPPRAGGGAATLFSYARQMKTINFALSSRKCLEDGWTVTNYKPPPKTPEPVLYDTVDDTQSHPRPGLAIPWQQDTQEFNKYYHNGTVFLTLLDDGTGICYYPSGAPAVIITLEQPGIYCYYVLSDSDDNARLLAVCSQQGRTTVFYPDSKLHYVATPLEGSLFSKDEVRTKHWQWDAFQPHVHAPPFQPVYFQISPFFSMRCVSLDQQTLVFNYKRYTFKCSVGSRTKKLQAKPLECLQLMQYNRDLIDTKSKINENLRKLNTCITSARNLGQSHSIRIAEQPQKSPASAKVKSAESTRVVTLAV